MRERTLTQLGSPVFVLAVALLLVNDFFLKQQFHNAVTGKLSDVAGLFAFAVFWSAIFPELRTHIVVLTAIGFVFLKSPLSHTLVEGWNRVGPFTVARTVDATDLFAFLVLPLAYAYALRVRPHKTNRPLIYTIAVISLFAFTATSFSRHRAFTTEYTLPFSRYSFDERLKKRWHDAPVRSDVGRDYFEVIFDDKCDRTAYIGVGEVNGQAKVRLWLMNDRCPSGGDPVEMQKFFEQNFVEPISAPVQAPQPSKVSYIRAIEMRDIPQPDPPK